MAQREKGRHGCMDKIDGVLLQKNKKVKERLEKQRKRSLKAIKAAEEAKSMAILEDSSTNIDSATDSENVAGPSSSSLPPERGRKEIISADLALTLDRTNVSDRSAMFIVSSTAKSLGCNIEEFALNRSTIRRSRQQHRKELAAEVFQNFSPSTSVHWDGKLLPDLTAKQKVDRLAILVSCQAETQLLCIPKLPSGTGEAQASAVCDAIKQWGLQENIQAMCFDTTSNNTGCTNGACIIVEQKLFLELFKQQNFWCTGY